MAPVAQDGDDARQAAEAARQRLAQEREAARLSRLFATEVRADDGAPTAHLSMAVADQGASPLTGRQTILDGPVDRRTTSADRVQSPASPYVLQAGAVIPAALITGVRSDLPGQIVGQVIPVKRVCQSPDSGFRACSVCG